MNLIVAVSPGGVVFGLESGRQCLWWRDDGGRVVLVDPY